MSSFTSVFTVEKLLSDELQGMSEKIINKSTNVSISQTVTQNSIQTLIRIGTRQFLSSNNMLNEKNSVDNSGKIC